MNGATSKLFNGLENLTGNEYHLKLICSRNNVTNTCRVNGVEDRADDVFVAVHGVERLGRPDEHGQLVVGVRVGLGGEELIYLILNLPNLAQLWDPWN